MAAWIEAIHSRRKRGSSPSAAKKLSNFVSIIKKIQLGDAIITATALVHELTLVTLPSTQKNNTYYKPTVIDPNAIT
jgi:predicted nucleic acid-binding protein